MSIISTGTKPRLSLAQIINMSVGFLGIQFAFGLQNANVSRIFQTLGADINNLAILWIAAPLTGLIVQPLIGYYSDKVWLGKLGRRRPYFMLGSILAAVALFAFPNVPSLWIAVLLLWMLDGSINISMEPFRAFVGDMLPNEQRTAGFAMQSFFIGIGAVVSSMMPYILEHFHVANEAAPGIIPDTVKISFYIGAVVFIAAVSYTVLTTKEYSPAEMKSFGVIEENAGVVEIKTAWSTFLRRGFIWFVIGGLVTLGIFLYNRNAAMPIEKEVYLLAIGIAVFGLFQIIAAAFHKNKNDNGLVEIMDDLSFLPDTMKKLAVVQFFSWFALFSMWIYTTPALAQNIYNTTDTTSVEYNKLGNWVGVLFACYNGFSALCAFLLPVLAKKISRPGTHMLALIIGGLSFISFYFIKNENYLIVSMVGIGFAWASILAMPYSILTQSLPAHKMGVYMGIFNFFIVIPQILAATLLGIFLKHLFNGQAIFIIVLGGCSMIVAALLTLRLKDK